MTDSFTQFFAAPAIQAKLVALQSARWRHAQTPESPKPRLRLLEECGPNASGPLAIPLLSEPARCWVKPAPEHSSWRAGTKCSRLKQVLATWER